MAGKITIRRIGSVLPTVCLLLVCLLFISIVWLSVIGFPAAALRYVERLAAEQGVSLRVSSLHLYPSRGLALRAGGITLYATPAAQQPLATVGSISLGINASHLIMGELRPSFFMLSQGRALLPVTDPAGQQLVLDELNLAARFGSRRSAQITSGFVRVQGIPVRVQGSCDMNLLLAGESPTPAPTAHEKLDLPALLAARQDSINQIYRFIHSQHWRPEQLPSLDVRLAIQEEFRISLRSSIPSLDIGQFHFRDAHVDLQHNKDSITINSLRFNTVDPDASASLQGGYDLLHRHLSFTMQSNAALVRMLRQVSDGPLRDYLARFHHPDSSPPRVRLSGDICFQQDYTLQSARVRGDIEQKQLSIGSSEIDSAELSFFYDNGNFNIDKLLLAFPDGGSLQAIAAAQDGTGQAQLALDLPVQRLLSLAHDLGAQELHLPPGLELGERLRLTAHARLTAPAFKPGRSRWQGFVPTIHMLALELHTDSLAYAGHRLQEPVLHLRLTDVEQRRNLSLRSLGGALLSLKAEQALLAPTAAGGEPISVQAPDVRLELAGISCAQGSLPIAAQQLSTTLRVQRLDSPAAPRPISLSSLSASASLQQLSYDPAAAGPDALRAAAATATLSLAGASVADLHTGATELALESADPPTTAGGEAPPATPRTLQELLLAARLRATAADLARAETRLGSLSLSFHLPPAAPGSLSLQLTTPAAGESAPPCTLSASPMYSGQRDLLISDIRAELPHALLSLLPELLGAEVRDLDIPGLISLRGACTLARDSLALRSGIFRISVPELVRTPWRQAVFKGKRVPISLMADALLTTEPGGPLSYRISLDVGHESGAFHGLVTGSSAGQVHITGVNTIRPDVVDMLIDDEDAHSIIRDFRFPAAARSTISDIDTRVDYADGVRVDSSCRVELQNTEYLISVLEDTPGGGERLRTDLGSDPYTLVSQASCEVLVHVRLDCHAADGSPLPDESVVTINNAILNYNNTPWLRRQGWATGQRNTRLEGRSIIIDIEHSFVELVDVQGAVYPAYSLGMFYPDLQHYMEDVILPSPVQVQAASCVFPIYSDCTRPMSGVIRALSPASAAFRFLGTSIPLDDFSGFICITDDYVQLDRMNAKCWEGVLDATVRIGISGKRTSFDGYAKAQCMNLRSIAAAYGSKQSPALCSGEIRFRSPSPELTDIHAYGHIDVEDGDLMTLSLFRPVSDLISDLPGHFVRLEKEVASSTGQPAPKPGFFTRAFGKLFKSLGKLTGKTSDSVGRIASNVPGMNHLIAYDLQEAHTDFDIINGFFLTRGMNVIGYNLNVRLDLAINLDTLQLRGNLWPQISSLPTVLLAPFTFLSDFMVDIILYGKVDDIKWRIALDRRKPTQPPTATSAPAAGSPQPKRPAR